MPAAFSPILRRFRRAALWMLAITMTAEAFGVPAAQAAELMLRLGDTSVPRGTIVYGDAVVIGGTLDVGGSVTGNATVAGGSVDVSGHVGGDVRAVGGNVILESTAVVDGTVQSSGGSVRIAPGAVIHRAPPAQPAPPIPFPPSFPSPPSGPPYWMPPAFFGILAMWKLLAGLLLLLALFTFIGTAWLTAVMFPGATAAVARALEQNPGAAGVAGVLAWFLIGPVTVLLVLSVAGILLVLLLVAALLIAVQLGISAVAVLVGHRVRPGRIAVEALIGALLLTVVFAVPHLGWLAGFAAATWGTGGVVVAIMEYRRGHDPIPPAPPPPSPPSTGVPV